MNIIRLFTLWMITAVMYGCSESDDTGAEPEVKDLTPRDYFVGIESGPASSALETLSITESLDTGVISPVNNGFEQPTWMSFIQGVDQVFTAGFTSAPQFTSYELVNGELTEGESFFTDMGIYALDVVDEATMILMGSAREGFTQKKIYKINTNTMSIENTVSVDLGDEPDNNLFAFPVDLKVRGSKMFAAFYMATADSEFNTPSSNEAKVAVFSYPGLELEKVIVDDRAPNIGRYYTTNALEIDEKGDIYTFSPSSLACGYDPVPATNSGILRIKNNETEFDPNYHIDFESLSNGYKIYDLFYVKNGKAVVRMMKENEADSLYKWAAYRPTSPLPILETGIVDLYNESLTLLPDVPKGGGGWDDASLLEDGKLYLGVSNSTYAGIYVIDVENETATEGATIEGNYAKAILSLSE